MLRRILTIGGWVAVLAGVIVVGAYFFLLGRPHSTDPLESDISFDDLVAFASAHETAAANDYRADAYASNYFARGTAPVRTYMSQLGISAAQTAADARARPRVYDLIGSRTDDIVATEPDIRNAYIKFKERYPDAVFPPVHLLYGSFQARGLIRPFGILIGAEFFIAGDDAEDTAGWNNSSGLIVRPALLPSQLVHELAHIQQARRNPITHIGNGSVLNWAIYEGAADFVAAKISGAHTSKAAHAYLARNEDALWCAFYESTDESRRSHWLDADVFGRPPGGIAGAFGYQIAEAYYESSQDSDKALVELIELADYWYVYEMSGIESRLADRCS